MHEDRIADLEVLLGHSFRDKGFLVNALSHSSIKTDNRPSNERLEFLGDAVLGLIISEALYRRYPDEDEGTLTRIKSHAVSRATLQRVATAMGFDRFILVGKGVMKREIPASLLGNLFEALIGAIYLDTGLSASRKFIMRHLDIIVKEIEEDRAERNYKSMLQHYCQRERASVPTYKVLRETGPAHGRQFEVAIYVREKECGRARAASKKEAEQSAARAALTHFGVVEESGRQIPRGAGTVLSVGNGSSGSRRRGRRGGSASKAETTTKKSPARRRRSRPAAKKAEPAPAPEAAEPAPKKKKKSRRGRRGGRKTKASSSSSAS